LDRIKGRDYNLKIAMSTEPKPRILFSHEKVEARVKKLARVKRPN